MWRVEWGKKQAKEIRKLGVKAYVQIIEDIDKVALLQDPRSVGKPLKGRSEWRFRSGDYRILCFLDYSNKVITVSEVGHRKDIYEDLVASVP